MNDLIAKFEEITGDYPLDPMEQLRTACEHCFSSYFSLESRAFRSSRGVDKSACAIIIQGMVFGNLTTLSSGVGTAHSRNPVSGSDVISGVFHSRSESANDIVQGSREIDIGKEMQDRLPDIYCELKKCLGTLEREFKDSVTIEFTLESGCLYVLNASKSPRTPEAAMKIAVDLVCDIRSAPKSGKTEKSEEETRSVCISKKDALLRIPVTDLPDGMDPTWLRSDCAIKVLDWSDEVRTMSVMSNASNPSEAKAASLLRADGIGILEIERLISSPLNKGVMHEFSTALTSDDRASALRMLSQNLIDQISDILYVAPGVTITAAKRGASAELLPIGSPVISNTGKTVIVNSLLFDSANAHAFVLMPEFLECQVQAVIRAVLDTQDALELRFEANLIISTLISDHELDFIIPHLQNAVNVACREHSQCIQKKLAADEEQETKQGAPTLDSAQRMHLQRASITPLSCNFGVCISTTRACIRAATLVSKATIQFLAFDVNALTIGCFGVNSEESKTFMPHYLSKHILAANPFFTLDQHGVGKLIQTAVEEVRKLRKDVKFVAFGKQMQCPASIRFMQSIGVDVISVDSAALPTAKIAAAQAQIENQLKSAGDWQWSDAFKAFDAGGWTDSDDLNAMAAMAL
jgi:phosphoenolpyruvate synthase/pyruvate phosphate dikinase